MVFHCYVFRYKIRHEIKRERHRLLVSSSDHDNEKRTPTKIVVILSMIILLVIGSAFVGFLAFDRRSNGTNLATETVDSAVGKVDSAYCDFKTGIKVGTSGAFYGCEFWQEDGNSWAGSTVMVASSSPPCVSLLMTVFPNSWGSNTFVVSNSEGTLMEGRVGAGNSPAVNLRIPFTPGTSQTKIDFKKVWSPQIEDDSADVRFLSQPIIFKCEE